MNCSDAKARFAELLDNRLAEADTAEVRAHLASCPECQREFSSLAQTLTALDQMPTGQPSPRLRSRFYAMLEEEKNSAASVYAASQRRRRSGMRFAFLQWVLAPIGAAALVLGGFLAGTRYNKGDTETKRELAAVRNQVNSLNDLVTVSLLQQKSTSDRLQNVLATLDQRNPNAKTLSDLIGALALDPSVNVRLTALDALYPHAALPVVRSSVLASLPREQNPLVQVAMIDFLVAARDHNATSELEKLSRNEAADRSVREAARRGLGQLI
jgi:anti-sigma factor RsiW